jgi:murein DD-endopeptidase MepM/ murein hydrolase activator NlpD
MKHQTHLLRAIVLILLVVTGLQVSPLLAQEPTPTPETQATTIHVIQPGETLFAIAKRYGTTVEALVRANQIADPSLIFAGQRLVIPSGQTPAPQPQTTEYLVQVGDTLRGIAARFGVQPEAIARLNGITHPDLIIAGQPLLIPASGNSGSERIYTVVRGDTLTRIAARFGRSAWEIALANGLSLAQPIYPGQRLVIPGEGPPLPALPPPFVAVHAHPLPAVQGRAFAVRVTVTQGVTVTLSGSFADQRLRFVEEASGSWAIAGLNAFTPPGLYPLIITATLPTGEASVFQQRVQVVEPGYAREQLILDPQTSQLLDPQLLAEERAIVMGVYTQFTPKRLWEGLFQLPASGEITSHFGTRRSYNGGPYSSYHEGTDLNGFVGDPVVAPAAGRVALAQKLTVRGNAIILDHGGGVFSGYWHLSKIWVKVGDEVRPGQKIAEIGATGLVTGSHLHWEMRINGVPVDPMQWTREAMP